MQHIFISGSRLGELLQKCLQSLYERTKKDNC